MQRKRLGFVLMTLSALGLAFSTILMKIIPQFTSLRPGDVAIWRFTIAAPLFWLFMTFGKRNDRRVSSPVWQFLGLGVIYAVANFSAVFALSRLDSSLYVIIVYIYPSLVVLFSLGAGKPIPRLYWLGLPMTFLGLALTAYDFGQAVSIDLIGLLITILNALAMAAYMMLSELDFKKEKGRLAGTKWVLTGAMMAGLIMILLLGCRAPSSWRGWLLLLSFGVLGTLIPILLMNIGLQQIGAARASVIITLQPVLTVIFSTLFLGDSLTLQQWMGGAVVILAVFLLQRSSDRMRKK
jgi:drug/metabolite transporter (DMT)-like permease